MGTWKEEWRGKGENIIVRGGGRKTLRRKERHGEGRKEKGDEKAGGREGTESGGKDMKGSI